MRRCSEITAALPYTAKWTAAEIDITATTNSPVELVGLERSRFVNFSFAGDSASKSFTWQLMLIDNTIVTGTTPYVIRFIPITSTASARRQIGSGASGLYMHNDLIVDLSGVGQGKSKERKWVLGLVGIDTDSAAYLVAYNSAPMTDGYV